MSVNATRPLAVPRPLSHPRRREASAPLLRARAVQQLSQHESQRVRRRRHLRLFGDVRRLRRRSGRVCPRSVRRRRTESDPGLDGRRGRSAPHRRVSDGLPGRRDGRHQALNWAIDSVRKAGNVSVIGAYGPLFSAVKFGDAMNKGLTIRTNQCSVKRHWPRLFEHIRAGRMKPSDIVTHRIPLEHIAEGYHIFSSKLDGAPTSIRRIVPAFRRRDSIPRAPALIGNFPSARFPIIGARNRRITSSSLPSSAPRVRRAASRG